MTHDDSTAGQSHDPHAEEAKQRWGSTKAYAQSQERMKRYTPADMARMKAAQEENTRALASLMDRGIEDPEVQALIHEGFRFINDHFYECSLEMYENLAKMTLADQRFAEYYRTFHPDLPEFRTKAVLHYCAQKKK